MKTRQLAPLTLSIALLATGCDDVSNSPKIIEADGQTYIACSDLVWVTSDGGLLGGTFKVSYTDKAGVAHVVRGLRKVTVSDVPTMYSAPMPAESTLPLSYELPFEEGKIYEWADGSKARFRNGAWEAVQIPFNVCNAK